MSRARATRVVPVKSAPPPPPPPPPPPADLTNKKEPRNLTLPAKFDGTAIKLKEFMSKVDSTFERMPLTYCTTNDKILFVASVWIGPDWSDWAGLGGLGGLVWTGRTGLDWSDWAGLGRRSVLH